MDFTEAFDRVSHNILLQKLNDPGIRGDIWLWLKNYLTERSQQMRLRYTHCNSRNAVRVGPRTHVILALHKRPPKIITLSLNLSVCRRDNNILYRRNDGFANRQTH